MTITSRSQNIFQLRQPANKQHNLVLRSFFVVYTIREILRLTQLIYKLHSFFMSYRAALLWVI